jgi:hypothetical protein
MLIDFEEDDDMIAEVEEEERRDDVVQMSEPEEVKTSATQVIIKDRPVVKRPQVSEEEVKVTVKERVSITK